MRVWGLALSLSELSTATMPKVYVPAASSLVSNGDVTIRPTGCNRVAVANVIAKDVKTEGLTDAAIRKAVVAAKLGDAAMSGKADAYIDARFDILAEDAKKEAGADPFARVVSDGLKPTGDAALANDAYSKSVSDLNAWRKEA